MSATVPPAPSLLRQILSFVALVGAGIAVYMWLQISREAPRKRPANEQGRSVRVLQVQAMDAVPRTLGYGVVEAQREWQGVAEVSGVVVEVADRLEVGRIVQEGTVLVKIDPSAMAIEQDRSEASVKAVRAQIAELRTRESNAAKNLKIEERSLALARNELQRAKQLYAEGSAPLIEVENAERTVIAAEKAVQGFLNTIAELPSSRRILEAQLEQQQAGVATTRIGLAKTEIVAPFTMRLREVNVSREQVTSNGQVLVIGDGIDVFEIPTQVPLGSLGPLMTPRPETPPPSAAETPETPTPETAAADTPTADAPAADTPEPAAAPPTTGGRSSSITAIVRLENQGATRTWDGRFRRFGGIDPITQTMLAVVEVDDTRLNGERGSRLHRGLYVEVELRGQPRPGCLAVPRTAFHDGVVYVVDADKRLELRPVETSLIQEEFVCISKGLSEGEDIVLTDLIPAISGALLAPRSDDEAPAVLAQTVRGEPKAAPAPVQTPPPAQPAPDASKRGRGAGDADPSKRRARGEGGEGARRGRGEGNQ